MWGWTSIQQFGRDLHYATRMLRRSPDLTAAVVLSLALGIGANTAIFSLIDAVLLRMLPVSHPEQLVILDCLSRNGTRGSFSHADYEWISERNQVFSGVMASAGWRLEWNKDIVKRSVNASLVSGNFFSVLGVRPVLGRVFESDDERVSGGRTVAVIGYGLWRSEFGSSPSVLGQVMMLGGVPFEIVGVAPREFFGIGVGDSPDVWLPLTVQPRLNPGHSFLNTRNTGWLDLVARLKPGITLEQARVSLAVLYAAIQSEQHIDSNRDAMNRIGVSPGSGGISWLRARYSEPLHILMGMVALVLLIACANVSNLLLARATARQREFAIRIAMGAPRRRIVRQLLTESLLLAALSGAAGLAMAQALNQVLLAMANVQAIKVTLNWKILLFTAIVSLLTSVLFGITPSVRGSRTNPDGAVKFDSRTVGGHMTSWNFSHLLVTAQVALSVVLVVTASLFIRTLRNLENSGTGFDRDNVVQARIEPAAAGYKTEQMPALVSRMIERIQALPAVESASGSAHSFGAGMMRVCCVFVEGRTPQPDEEKVVRAQQVTAEYFRTMGIPIVLGHSFPPMDTIRPEVAVINETMALRYFGKSNPIGRHFGWSPQESGKIEIIGVAKDARYDKLREETPPMVYQLIWQRPANLNFIEVRLKPSNRAVATAVHDIRSAIKAVDGQVPVLEVTTMAVQVDRALGQERVLAQLSTAFGLLALVLASIGLYGLLSYGVVRKTQEIGVRLALGAQPAHVRWMVLRETLLLSGAGTVIGVVGAASARQLIATQLFGLSPTDPFTFALAAGLIVLVAVLAGSIPAMRASRIEPLAALRYE